jgi:uncharacterized protein YciI
VKYANYIRYVDDQEAIAAIRPTHRAYLADLLAQGKLAAAGPFTDGAGALFIYEAENADVAEEFAAKDPYTVGGVIAEHTIKPWQLVYSNTSLLQQPPG